MKRAWLIALGLVFLGLGAWFFLTSGSSGRGVANSGGETTGEVRVVADAMRALREAPLPPPKGALHIRGRVVGPLGPVAGAVVVATDGEGDDVLSTRACKCDNECGLPLLECGCGEASRQLVEFVSQRLGEAVPGARATTAADGTFELNGLDDRAWALWADHPMAGNAVLVGVRPSALDVEVTLSAGTTLTGTVKTDGDKPVPGALVTAVYAEHSRFFEGVSDGTGVFRIGPVPNGSYTLVASKEGLLPAHVHKTAARAPDLTIELPAPRALSGLVKRDGKPVGGAVVKLDGEHKKAQVTSGADGTFSFSGLRPGEYALVASLEMVTGSAQREIESGHDVTGVELELEPAGNIEGSVRDESGAPVASATVNALSDGRGRRRATAKTDASGAFRIEATPVGKYVVSAYAKGYLDVTPPAVERDESRVLTVGATLRVELTLKKGMALSGLVVDTAGNPVAHAEVTATAEGEDESYRDGLRGSAKTGADGHFEVVALEARKFKVVARHEAFATTETTATAPAAEVRLVLKGGASISGRVVDENDVVAMGAQVQLLPDVSFRIGKAPSDIDAAKQTTTDGRGEFKFGGVKDGKYALIATFVGPAKSFAGGRTALKRVEMVAQRNLTADLVFEKGLSISGSVVDGQGKPVAKVSVMARPVQPAEMKVNTSVPEMMENMGRASTCESKADGTFELPFLKPGQYQLTAVSRSQMGRPNSVTVAAGQTGVTLTAESETMIRGRVVANGSPVTEFHLNGRPVNSADGKFETPAVGDSEASVSVAARGYATATRQVKFSPGVDVALGDVALTTGRTVVFTVVDAASGQPLAGALVGGAAVWDEDSRMRQGGGEPQKSGADGKLSVSKLDEGATTVSVWEDDRQYLPLDAPVPAGVHELTVKLERGARVLGTVVDAASKAVVHGNVEVNPIRGDGPETATQAAMRRPGGFAAVKPDGTFEVDGLAPGKYRVSVNVASGDGSRRLSQTVELAPRGEARVDFKVASGATTLTVRTLNASGEEIMALVILTAGDVAMPTTMAQYAELRANGFMPSRSDDRSRLKFGSLPGGAYSVFVTEPAGDGLVLFKTTIEVIASGTQEVEVRTEGTGTPLKRTR